MANLENKLSGIGDSTVYTKANGYFAALNSKLQEAKSLKLELKRSYLSKYELVDDLRSKLRDEFRLEQVRGSSTSEEDFVLIKPLLDINTAMTEIATDEDSFNLLETYLNDLATNVKGAFEPPIADSFVSSTGTTVYPIPQAGELDARRYGRVLEFDVFPKPVKDWLIDNAILYGFTLYEDYGLYYIGFSEVQQEVQSKGVAEVINRFQLTPIPADQIDVTSSEVVNAKDPVLGDLVIATLSGPVKDNNGNAFAELAIAPGGTQLLPKEPCLAAMALVAAAKLDGLNLSVNSGFRPATNTPDGKAVRWTSSDGQSGKLTTQESIRRSEKRFVKSHKDYKKYTTSPGVWNTTQTTGDYGTKSGKEAFIFYSGASAYDAATAAPGKSNHGSGIAADFNTGSRRSFGAKMKPGTTYEQNYIWLCKNAHKFGYIRAVSSEEWHFEYRPDEAVKGPYARVKPGSGKLVNNGWYADIGLDNLTA